MGNHVVRSAGTTKKATGPKSGSSVAQTKPPISRSSSGADIQNTSHTQFLPIDRLAKILTEISQKEEAVNGITQFVFQKYLFPHHPELADRLFSHLHASSKVTTTYLGQSVFKHQAEKFLAIMNDQTVLENYVKMFSENKEESEITPDGLRKLLMVSYRLAMSGNRGVSCTQILNTVSAVVNACFHGKDTLSVSFVSNWLWQNCQRIVHGMHKYVIHILTTAYRSGKSLMSSEQSGPHLVPSTPVLDQPDNATFSETLLSISHVWLLAATLPYCYTKTEEDPHKDGIQALITKMSGTVCLRHWTPLYNSDQHGAAANRFLHHVLGYKGPTLIFIRGVNDTEDRNHYPTYCICSAAEWRESHLYWGNEDSMVIELLPNYRVVQKGSKLLYLNTSIRGYPQGLRAGADPRSPCVAIDQSFHEVNFAGVPYRISSLEVWGCGDSKSRERQLEIKKWQVKEAEKQRVVKLSTSEWLDHPDRYLLELAGRPSYNNSSS
ncbi:PREDICTED: uncharacterized protein LOC105365432 [Ceratosolen solmsi marchali]|uniref:Uncharacterized protein LOC105365432 n=1 Tax=Ceratosolen solmsi marchali TaxID=326594 RepID=A0AAJ6YPL1_9HYME|nr:PREDICTED: uncharacterized protein LOC105365432 [Ceratosolen solmsi marchali]